MYGSYMHVALSIACRIPRRSFTEPRTHHTEPRRALGDPDYICTRGCIAHSKMVLQEKFYYFISLLSLTPQLIDSDVVRLFKFTWTFSPTVCLVVTRVGFTRPRALRGPWSRNLSGRGRLALRLSPQRGSPSGDPRLPLACRRKSLRSCGRLAPLSVHKVRLSVIPSVDELRPLFDGDLVLGHVLV